MTGVYHGLTHSFLCLLAVTKSEALHECPLPAQMLAHVQEGNTFLSPWWVHGDAQGKRGNAP